MVMVEERMQSVGMLVRNTRLLCPIRIQWDAGKKRGGTASFLCGVARAPPSSNTRDPFPDTRSRDTMAPSTIRVSGAIGPLNV